MSVAARPLFAFDDSFVRELEGLYVPWQGAPVAEPRLLALNEELAAELGVDPATLRSDAGVDVLVGKVAPEGATPVAQAYAGHQFGSYSPRLGDGRALLLGEVVDVHGNRRDLHLKGSGRTPFARGGDGKAVVGPMLREYVIGEAMHALGIPTSRALAVVATGEDILREAVLPGAVLARVAASHIRVGTFQYAAMTDDPDLVRRLADYSIARHHPQAAEAENPYVAFYESVIESQASLVAQWMLVGFIHGVMNTDNMAISGETIDYGPCAFMDAFDPATVFSSIDHGGRYAYGNQPHVAPWNLARLAEALLPLLDEDKDAAVAIATETLRTLPRALPPPLERRDAGQARGRGGRRRDRRARRRPAHAAARARPRLHLDVPGAVGIPARRSRAGAARRVGRPGGASSSATRAQTSARSPRRWTGSTRSTSRATTRSRTRSPRPRPATSGRSSGWSTWSRGPSTSAPASRRTPRRRRRAGARTRRSAAPDLRDVP